MSRVTSTTHELPFERLSPRDFERLCLWLLRREGYPTAQHVGAAGQDRGRDLVAKSGDSEVAFQCKREKQFGPAKAENAIRKILAEGPTPSEILLLVASDVSLDARKRAEEAAGDIPCVVWAGTELDERVKRHPKVIEEFFHFPKWEALQKAHRRQSVLDLIEAQWLRLYGFRRRYFRRLRTRHRTFNVQGIATRGAFPLELEQVFVDLKVAPQSLQDLSPALLRAESLTEKRSVWKLLISRHSAFRSLAVIGPPGSGKTTLLQHLTLVFAANKQRKHERRCRAFVPILLFLRLHVDAITAEQPPSLAELVTAFEAKEGLRPPKEWFERKLRAGRALVLLDGLDEVAGFEQRRRVVEWVAKQIERYEEARFLMTSRPYGYQSNPLPAATVIEVQPFTPEQVERFISSWYLANEALQVDREQDGAPRDAETQAQGLIRQLRNTPNLASLLVNPLLLAMVVLVHRHRGKLPDSRVELYAEICDVLLGHWQEAKGLAAKLTPDKQRKVLQHLAFYFMEEKRRATGVEVAREIIRKPLAEVQGAGAQPAQFLEGVQERSGLLLEPEAGSYSFAHLTFQEYLAAAHIRDERDPTPLLTNVGDAWWHETIRLYAAQSDATPIIRACLDVPELTAEVLALAYECLKEGRQIAADAREELERELLERLEASEPERRKLAAEVMLELRLRNLLRLSENVEIDTSYISCAEYQLFIDEKRAAGEYRQPDHWRESRFVDGMAQQPMVGVRLSDAIAFCEWLTEREANRGASKHTFRLPSFAEAVRNPIQSSPEGDPFDRQRTDSVGTWTLRLVIVGVAKKVYGQFRRSQLKAIALSFDRDLVRELASYRASALDLARARDRDRAFDMARDSDREGGINLAAGIAHSLGVLGGHPHVDLAKDIARDRARERDRDLDLALDMARDLARELEGDFDLAAVSARSLGGVLGPDRDRDSYLERARALVNDLAHARGRDLHRDRDLHRARASALDLARASDCNPDDLRDFDRARHEDIARDLDLPRDHDLVRELASYRASGLNRDRIRARDHALEIYNAIIILEERIKGNLPAWEGIRIVRERIPDES